MFKNKEKDRKSLYQYPQKNINCRRYEFCPQLSKGKCKNQHSARDKELADYIEDIIQLKKTVILLDSSLKKPICIYDQDLSIKLSRNQDENLESGKYYQAALVRIQEPNIIVQIQKIIGDFGNINCQLRIIDDYFFRQYNFEKAGDKKILYGHIKVNNQNKKVLRGEDRKYYLEKVNKQIQYPLMQGSEVKYFVERGQPRVVSVKYQNIKVSGYIQIDSNGQFYLICRNQKYDDMNPNTIPQEIVSKLIDSQKIFPYSFLKKSFLNQEKKGKINAILKQYLVKGKFEDWPINYKYPIASLQNQCEIKSFKSLKNAIIYELGIDILPFTKKQISDSKKIASKFSINNYTKKDQESKQYIFTFDSSGTSCYDDALSFQKTPQYTNINIYIADVAEIVPEGCLVDEEARHRDSTVYVKNYYQPMFHEQLRNIFSLKRGQSKLALMLSFRINQKGIINFESVKFTQKVIKISQNYRHQRFDINDENLKIFFEVGQQLQKSSIIKNSYFLQTQTKSEMIVSQIVLISSLIPTFLFGLNQKRVNKYKQKFDGLIETFVSNLKQKFKEWEQITNRINKVKKIERQKKNEAAKIQNQINKQLKKCKKLFLKQLKQETIIKKQKQKKQKPKKQKTEKHGKIDENQQADSQLGQEETLDDNISDSFTNEIQSLAEISENQNEIQKDDKEAQKQFQIKQKKRKQRLQEINNVQSEIQSNDQISSQSDLESVKDRNRQKMNSALGGKRFMEGIFDYFKIMVDWTDIKKINCAFDELKKQQKSNLFQLYVKNVQITNKQHFPYIIQMQIEKNPKIREEKDKIRRKQSKGKEKQSKTFQETKFEKKIEQKNDIQSKKKKKPSQIPSKKQIKDRNSNEVIGQNIKSQLKSQNIQITSSKSKIQVINLQNQQNKKGKQIQQSIQNSENLNDKKKKKKYRLVQNSKNQNELIKQSEQMDINYLIDDKIVEEKRSQNKNQNSQKLKQAKQPKKPKQNRKRNKRNQNQKGQIMHKNNQNSSNPKIQELGCKNLNNLHINQQTSKQNGDNMATNLESNSITTDQPNKIIQRQAEMKNDEKSFNQQIQISFQNSKQTKQIKQENKGKKNQKKKNVKNQIQAEVEQKLKIVREQLKIKYQEKLKKIQEQKGTVTEEIKKLRGQFKNELDKIEYQFNIIEFLNQLNQKEQKKEKKQKKAKKSKKEKKPPNMIKNIYQMLIDYANDAQYSFKLIKYKELDAFLSQKIKLEQIQITEENLFLLESEASKLCKNQDDLLKWNNPIRCYTSLLTQRMIKQNRWLFEGQISPMDIIQKHKHLKQVKEKIKKISKIKLDKIQKGETNKNAKEANRQIAKLQFYYLIKKDVNKIFTFLNIGSPNENKVKMVFHQILGTIEVQNFEFKQNKYKTVKGKVMIVQDFPLKLEVQLIE